MLTQFLVFLASMAATLAAAPFLIGILIYVVNGLRFRPTAFERAMEQSYDIVYPIHLLRLL